MSNMLWAKQNSLRLVGAGLSLCYCEIGAELPSEMGTQPHSHFHPQLLGVSLDSEHLVLEAENTARFLRNVS